MTTYESYLEIDAANMSTSEQDTLQYLDNQDFNANNCEKFELESRLSRLQYALEVLLIKVNEKKP